MKHQKHVRQLMDDASELVSKLRDSKSPEVRELRDRVDAFISNAKHDASERNNQRIKITRIPRTITSYVEEHPWLAVLTAASLSWTLSHLSTASRGSRQ